MLRHRQGALLAATIAVALGSAACREEEPPPLFTVMTGATGCVIEQVTNAPYNEYQVQGVSRDGRWLAYAWDNGEDEDGNPIRGAYNLDLTTGERVEMPNSINNSGSFSPDGRHLVGAQYTPDGRTDIYELDLETGEAVAVAPHEQWDFLPSYSPDGRYILFNSSRSGNSEIYLFERGDEELQQLTNFEGYDAHGEFSPDGGTILFHRMVNEREEGGYDFDLYSFDVATGRETRLTSTPYEESYGSWAPDGSAIVFSSDFEEQPERHNLYIQDSSGEIIAKLTDGAWQDRYSYWTRDGSFIYFNSDRSGVSDIYRIRMNGTDCERTG